MYIIYIVFTTLRIIYLIIGSHITVRFIFPSMMILLTNFHVTWTVKPGPLLNIEDAAFLTEDSYINVKYKIQLEIINYHIIRCQISESYSV